MLFVAGAPATSDATATPTFAREGDRTIVRFATDESYTVPDAFLRGG